MGLVIFIVCAIAALASMFIPCHKKAAIGMTLSSLCAAITVIVEVVKELV